MATSEGTLEEFLKNHKLGKYCEKFEEQGACEIEDVLKNIDREILTQDIGMTNFEANKLMNIIKQINKGPSNEQRQDTEEILRQQRKRTQMQIKYQLFTDFEPIPQIVGPFDTTTMYYCDLVNTICESENLRENTTVDLYTSEGYPLACSPSSYVLKLFEWHLEAYSDMPLLYAIPRLKVYTNKQVNDNIKNRLPKGKDIIHIQNIDVPVRTNCNVATFDQLLFRIQSITGIPTHLFSLYIDGKLVYTSENKILSALQITNEKGPVGLELRVNEEFWEPMLCNNFSFKQYHPTWYGEQSEYGTSVFFSSLFALFGAKDKEHKEHVDMKTLGHIRSLTGCPPLIHALNILITNKNITLPHIVAITEMLLKLFHLSKPKTLKEKGFVGDVIQDSEVAEHSLLFWTYLISRAEPTHEASEQYESSTLICSGSEKRMTNPVMVRDPKGADQIIEKENYRGDESRITYLTDYKRLTTSFPPSALDAVVWKGNQMPSCCVDLTREWENLKAESKTIPPLAIHPPLNVKTCAPPCIIPIFNEKIGIYTGYAKDGSHKSNYFDVILGEEKIVCPEELDEHVKKNPPKCMQDLAPIRKNVGGMQTLTREPQEIIMVLLDTSGSMEEKYLGDKTKTESVITAFTAFSDRASAYDLKHGMGLILFTENAKLLYPISENLRDFSSKFSAFPSGQMTAVYDAIAFAVEKLNAFYTTYPEYAHVPRRILCLTDGCDNQSISKPEDALGLLIQNNIIMDVVLLVPMKVDTHLIAKASGGYSFQPSSSDDIYNIFENEPMLTMKMRKAIKPLFLPHDKISLLNLQFDFDIILEHKIPENKLEQPATTIYKCLTHEKRTNALTKNPANPAHIKRILQELAYFVTYPNSNFEIFPCQESIDFWQLLLKGPDKTNYENKLFRLYIEFSDKYPKECPNIRFITPIYHCNINQAGKVCHSILDKYYSSDVRIRHILDYVCALLMDPTPDDPLDSVKANQLRFNPELYNKMAKEYSQRYAIDARLRTNTRMQILGRPMESAGTIEPDEELICPLTTELFEDPVSTNEGDSYEREIILAHIRSGNEFDPFSRLPLKEEDLRPNIILKKMVEKFKKDMNFMASSNP